MRRVTTSIIVNCNEKSAAAWQRGDVQNLHEHILRDGISSSSRTSSSFFCVPYRSSEFRAGIGDVVNEAEEPDDFDECPRDQTEAVGDVADDLAEVDT